MHLEPKVMDVLVVLAEHGNELVTRNELFEAVWHGKPVSDERLTRVIADLRQAIDDDRGNPKYIETIPKRGYRLIRPIRLPVDSKLDLKRGRFRWMVQHSHFKKAFIVVTVLILAVVFVAYNEFATEGLQEKAPATMDTQAQKISGTNEWEMSIAVLPFVNISDDPGNEYFSDGLSEEILSLLAKIPDLKVIGRTSSFSFKGKDEDLRVIGQKLGVKTVLEGSVRRSGDRVRITAQLVDASDGAHIWSDSYDRMMIDIFEVQEDVAAAIIDAVQLHVAANPSRGRPTEVPEAYALFLKAKVGLNLDDQLTAIADLNQAIELDPNFAEAYELLAHSYWTQYIPGIGFAEAQMQMRDAAAKALQINAELVFAKALYEAGNAENISSPDVIDAFMEAAREQPNNPAILRTLSYELGIAGYLEEALRVAERLVEVDPLSFMANMRHCALLTANGRVKESLAALEAARALNPEGVEWYFGEHYLSRHLDEQAIEHFRTHVRKNENTNSAWVEDLVTNARDLASGQTYLGQRIPTIVQLVHPDNPDDFESALNRWYLIFGYLNRYFDIIIDRIPSDSTWTDVSLYVWYGTIYRDLGFTAHPKYLEVAELMGYIDVWERRGPPDFCAKVDGRWDCE